MSPVADLCVASTVVSSPTFYKWKAKYGGLDVSEARQAEGRWKTRTGKLKRMLADAMLDNVALKDLLGKKW